MDPIVQNIIAGGACLVVSAAAVVKIASSLKLFKLKAEIQEDLANTYTPEILGVVPEKTKKEGSDGEQKETENPEAGTTGSTGP